jgi:hypothetical protein
MSNRFTRPALFGFLTCAGATALHAQEQRVAVPLSEPTRPATLVVALFAGSVTVRAYDGTDVVVVTDTPIVDAAEAAKPRPDGLRRLQSSSVGMTAEESGNTVTLRMDYNMRAVDLEVLVPTQTSIHANLVNGGIVVTGVTGEHEITTVNGDIEAMDISGAAVINSTNGTVHAVFAAVAADKPLSLVSFNGDVDVSLPANLAADLIVTSQQGEVFTDFDVEPRSNPAVVDRGGNAAGGVRVRMHRETRYAIGGGGPPVQLRTFNGDIMIRKR